MIAPLALRRGPAAAALARPHRGGSPSAASLPSWSHCENHSRLLTLSAGVANHRDSCTGRVARVLDPFVSLSSSSSSSRNFCTSQPRRWRPKKTRYQDVAMAMPAGTSGGGGGGGSGRSSISTPVLNTASNDPLVWIDCEMTGLNPDTEEILEIYCIITTGNLQIIDDEGFHAVLHCPEARLDRMDEWCTATHGSTGLTAACIESTTTPAQAADALYAYITRFVPTARQGILAGSSVHVDREFLRRGPFGRVVEHLHYRILDVSAIKEAARRWSPVAVVEGVPRKVGTHKARDDILESIAEARYYRDVIFRGRT